MKVGVDGDGDAPRADGAGAQAEVGSMSEDLASSSGATCEVRFAARRSARRPETPGWSCSSNGRGAVEVGSEDGDDDDEEVEEGDQELVRRSFAMEYMGVVVAKGWTATARGERSSDLA